MPEILHYQSVFFLLPPAVIPFACSICHFLMPPRLSTTSSFFLSSAPHLSPLPGHVLPSTPDFLFLWHLSYLPPHTSADTLLSQAFCLIGVLYFLLGGDLQASCGTLDEGGLEDNIDWEEEREMERLACEGDDFVPPKIMVRHQYCNDMQIL